jgi:multiple sugar transport system permease protein
VRAVELTRRSTPTRRWAWRRRWSEYLIGYFFVSPFIVGFLAFYAGPMVASAILAFLKYDLITAPQFAGTANLERMVGDDLFYTALYNTAFYTVLAVPLQVSVALMLALALSIKIRGMAFFRTGFYLPSVTPAVAAVALWVWIYNPDYGLANALLRSVGLPGLGWLWDPTWSKPSLVIMSLWGVGTQMVVFLAGLQSVPAGLLEAAAIDGAGRLRKFWNVTIPILSPVILFNLVVGVINSFQVFTVAFIATDGGPRDTTLMYVLFLYREAFKNFRMGYASALAWTLFLVIMAFTLAQFTLARRWVHYESDKR